MKISTFFSRATMFFSLMMVFQITSLTASEFAVKFLRVEAEQISDQVLVRWVTDSEFDNEFFTVQRSTDGGQNWQALGSQNSSGNTPGGGDYVYIDEIPEEGLLIYRIQQTDFDGTYSYSIKASVDFSFFTDEDETEVQVYPNPANEIVTVESESTFTENVTVELMDISGKLIGLEADVNDTVIQIRPIQQLSGLYFIMITDRNKRNVKKIKFK